MEISNLSNKQIIILAILIISVMALLALLILGNKKKSNKTSKEQKELEMDMQLIEEAKKLQSILPKAQVEDLSVKVAKFEQAYRRYHKLPEPDSANFGSVPKKKEEEKEPPQENLKEKYNLLRKDIVKELNRITEERQRYLEAQKSW